MQLFKNDSYIDKKAKEDKEYAIKREIKLEITKSVGKQ